MSSSLDQDLLDLEAMRSRDILEIDATEGRCDAEHRLDELLRMLGMDLDVEHVDVGKVLEQDRLAFHHRLAGERADIAEPEHRACRR